MNVSPVASSDKVQSALTNLGIPDGFVANDVVPLLQQLVVALGNVTSGGGGGSAVWGDITGTLSNQTDLQNALDAKSGIITTPAIIYVETSGNDSTAVIGRPDLPFQTAQAAYAAGVAANDPFALCLGVGEFSITLTESVNSLLRSVRGAGGLMFNSMFEALSKLSISGTPAAVTNSNGAAGYSIADLYADGVWIDVNLTGGSVTDVNDAGSYTAGNAGSVGISGPCAVSIRLEGGSLVTNPPTDGACVGGNGGTLQITNGPTIVNPLADFSLEKGTGTTDGTDGILYGLQCNVAHAGVFAASSITLGCSVYYAPLTITDDKGGNAAIT